MVEVTCAHEVYAGATRVAVAAIRAALERNAKAWCAWIDTQSTLYAPGLARAGVDLRRLLVVRPEKLFQRALVKVTASGAFDVVVVDVPSVPAVTKLIRKLALAAEQHGSTVVLLAPPHSNPWPVALRLEVARTQQGIDVRITKDRFGRASPDLVFGLAKTSVPIRQQDTG